MGKKATARKGEQTELKRGGRRVVNVGLRTEDIERVDAWAAKELGPYATTAAGVRLALVRQGVIPGPDAAEAYRKGAPK